MPSGGGVMIQTKLPEIMETISSRIEHFLQAHVPEGFGFIWNLVIAHRHTDLFFFIFAETTFKPLLKCQKSTMFLWTSTNQGRESWLTLTALHIYLLCRQSLQEGWIISTVKLLWFHNIWTLYSSFEQEADKHWYWLTKAETKFPDYISNQEH